MKQKNLEKVSAEELREQKIAVLKMYENGEITGEFRDTMLNGIYEQL